MIRDAFPDEPPTVLDCFAGGASIPLEALRLGCNVTALDLNPVAHLIERCALEYPQRFGSLDDAGRNSLAEDVRYWAREVGQNAERRLAHCYPESDSGEVPLVFFWARTAICRNPSCGVEIPLVKTWWLAKGRRKVWLSPKLTDDGFDILVRSDDDRPAPPDHGTVRAASATCPVCGLTISASDMRTYGKSHGFGARLLAVMAQTPGGRVYRTPSPSERAAATAPATDQALSDLDPLHDGTTAIPDEDIDPTKYRRLQSLVFGIQRYRDLFTPRQLLAAATLCEETRLAHRLMIEDGMRPDRAQAVSSYLALIVSRVVDFNSSFATWNSTAEIVRNTYARQAIAMVWDFTEIDPFRSGSGGWSGGIEPVAAAIEHCSQTGTATGRVIRANAQLLEDFPDASFDAVITDPPYYDAIQYADLSDFFYVWLKRSVGGLYGDLFSTPLTPKAHEIIENTADRKTSSYISADEFERRLARAIGEIRRVIKPGGVVTLIFAHTESDAWERLLRALLQAGLVVSTSWPMQSEKRGRATANVSAVLGSSVVLVCRPRVPTASAFYDDVVSELDRRIAGRLGEFEELGLDGADYLISAIGPAFEVFGKYQRVERLNGEEVSVAELLSLARRTVARHAMRRLLGSDALAAVDDVSLYYLTWRWAFGPARIPVDEAQKLGKALNVDANELDGIDGLVDVSRETYALRGPDDRKRIRLGAAPLLIDVLHVACKLFERGRRQELAEVLAGSGFSEQPAFWAVARAIAESLPDGDRERILLVNLLGGQSQAIDAARQARPNDTLRLFEVAP
jgi:adenine-specific DNA methylase